MSYLLTTYHWPLLSRPQVAGFECPVTKLCLLSFKGREDKMIVFGHTGITLAVAILFNRAVNGSCLPKAFDKEVIGSSPRSSQVVPNLSNSTSQKASWVTSLGRRIDIRLLLVGSLLPDIIDKPVGQVFFRETLSNGRIFCHTLLFLIIITLAGLHLYRYRSRIWLLVFSFGTFTHLVCDQMWRSPRTLLWPAYGIAFERVDLTDWMPNMLYALLTSSEVYIPELVGAAIIIWLAVELVRKRKVFVFVKYGQM